MGVHKAHTRTDTNTQTHTSKEDNFVELINISMDEYKNTSRKVSPSSPATARGGKKSMPTLCTDVRKCHKSAQH